MQRETIAPTKRKRAAFCSEILHKPLPFVICVLGPRIEVDRVCSNGLFS